MKQLIFALLLLMALGVQAAPSVTLFSNTPFCGGFGEPQCETVYKIAVPALDLTPIAVNQDTFKISFRTDADMALTNSKPQVSNVRLYINEKELDREKVTETFSPGETYYIKVTGKREWVFNGEDYETKPIDNVLTAFGIEHNEWAWWNTSKNFKQNFTIVQPATLTHNISVVYTVNLSYQVAQLRIDQNGTCLQIVNESENQPIPFEHEPGNLTLTNYTAWFFTNFPGAGNYTFWAYYDNGHCVDYYDDASTRWNETGAMIATHFTLDTANSSSFYDSAGGDQNATRNGTIHIVPNYFSQAMMVKSTEFGNAIYFTDKINNLPSGTAIFWLNMSSVQNQYVAARGVLGSWDFTLDITTQAPSCSLDATVTRATHTSGILPGNLTMVVCSWNTSGLYIYKDGIYGASQAGGGSTGGIPNNSSRKLNIGKLQGYSGINKLNGSVTEFQLYNRTLTPQEIIAIWNASKSSIYGVEFNNTPIIPPGPTGNLTSVVAYDEDTGERIWFNATFDNTTTTFTTPNTYNYTNESMYFPSGQNTITFYNASYYSRNLIQTMSNTSIDLAAYLIPIGYAYANFVNYHVQDTVGSPISSALITLQKSFDSTYTTVGQCLTDASGTCQLISDSQTSYKVIVSKNGYLTSTNIITPVGPDYTFTLSGSTTTIFSGNAPGISYSIEPPVFNVPNNWTIINYSIIAEDSNLLLYGMNVSYNGVIIYNQTNTTPATGGTILINISTVNRLGNVTVFAFWQTTGGQVYGYQRYYYIYNNTVVYNYSVSRIFEQLRTNAPSPFMLVIPLLLFVAFIVGSVNRRMPIGAGTGILAVGLLGFGMFALAGLGTGLTEWLVLSFLAILALAMLRIRTVG